MRERITSLWRAADMTDRLFAAWLGLILAVVVALIVFSAVSAFAEEVSDAESAPRSTEVRRG